MSRPSAPLPLIEHAARVRAVAGALAVLLSLALPAPPVAAHLAVPADGPIRIDGLLDEPVWAVAPEHDTFRQHDPYTGGPAPYRTGVRFAHDAQALYVAIHARDPAPAALRAPLVRYDKVFRDQDFVVVYVDAVGSGAAAQFFRVSASGSVGDGVHTAANDSEDFAPDFVWDAAARIVDDGYLVEIRIPFSELRFAHHGSRPWRVQVARRMPREQTYLFISTPLTRADPSFIAALQPLQGFAGPRSEAGWRLTPTLTARRSRESPDDPDTRDQRIDAGLDLKWRPRADWVIDATLNPDFSQVELDVPQLSRTRQFALLLPEKRPFFLEGSDLLQTPTDSLYTRTVSDPRWGARATYRGDALAATVLSVADQGGGLLLLPRPFSTGLAQQPASHASSARLRWDTPGLMLGAIATDRRYQRGGADLGHNRIVGPDAQWQINGEQFVRGQLLLSSTSAQPGNDGSLLRAAERSGHLANLEWFRNSAQAALNLRYREAGSGFRNDNGFVAQNGFRQWRGSVNRQFRPAARPLGLHEVTPFVDLLHAGALDGGATITRELHPGLYLGGPRGTELTLQYRPAEGARVQPGSRLHRYRQWYASYTGTPSPLFAFVTGELTLGERVDVLFDRVRPAAAVSLSGRIRLGSRFELEPRIDGVRMEADDGSLAQSESAAQWLSVLHLTARDSLRLIVQWTRFRITAAAAPAAQPVDERGTNGSLVYAHRWSAASVLYAGAARGRDRSPAARASSSEAFVKLQFAWP